MPAGTARPPAEEELEFYFDDMSGLLNVNSVPQKVADNELTVAQNVYGQADGGVTMRKGMSNRGTSFGSNPFLGGFRFEQKIINGVVQNPSVVKLLGQIGGQLVDVDAHTTLTGATDLGAAANMWDAQPLFDGDHTLPTPGAPTNAAPTGGGTLAAGTYLVSVTWKNAAGETINGPDDTIVITINQKVVINQPTPPIGATIWNVYASTPNGARGTEKLQSADIPIATTTFTLSSLLNVTAPPVTNGAIAPCDVLVICTGSGGPYVWDGSIVYTPAAWSANAASASWCDVFNFVLFFGGIPGQPNLVVGMTPGHPETLPPGAINSFQTSHNVTGLGNLSAGGMTGLFIGMTNGVSVLWGIAGSSSFVLQEIPSEEGCQSGYSIITVDGVCYFLGATDFYACDGTKTYRLGLKVRPYLTNDPLATGPYDVPITQNRQLAWTWYYNQRIHLVFQSAIGGAVVPNHNNAMLVWDLALQGWTTIIGPTLNAAALMNATGDDGKSVVVFDATKGQAYNWDVYNGTGHNVDDAGATIAVFAQSKFFKLARPLAPKKVMRVFPEIFVDTTFAGNVLVTADYGSGGAGAITYPQSSTGGQWDAGQWDQAQWGAGTLAYVDQRVDFDIVCEAAAIAIQSNDVNPPWRWVGAKACIVQEPTS